MDHPPLCHRKREIFKSSFCSSSRAWSFHYSNPVPTPTTSIRFHTIHPHIIVCPSDVCVSGDPYFMYLCGNKKRHSLIILPLLTSSSDEIYRVLRFIQVPHNGPNWNDGRIALKRNLSTTPILILATSHPRFAQEQYTGWNSSVVCSSVGG